MNKKISFPIAIIIIIVLAGLVIGGVLAYQYWWASEEEALEEAPVDETADWEVYRSEKYGFEIKYPENTERINYFNNDTIVAFEIRYYELEENIPENRVEKIYEAHGSNPPTKDGKLFIGEDHIRVGVIDNASNISIRDWIQKYERCGYRKESELDIEKVILEDFVLNDIEGVRIKDLGGCPPGASFIVDTVYFSKDSKIYQIYVLDVGDLWWKEKALELRERIFDQMLSTFRFID